MTLRALGPGLLLVGLACTQRGAAKRDPHGDGGLQHTLAAALYPAVRCAECHDKMYQEWKGSAHARAQNNRLYLAMRARVGAEGKLCERCHAPLASHADPLNPAGHEGVSCETCHRIREASARHEGAAFRLELLDTIKFGPLCDAKTHYFHKMGCSPLHEQARLCASCHLWFAPRPDGEVPVYTEYEEWRTGPFAGQGVDCQGCHMPGDTAQVATGSPERAGVPHHGFLSRDGKLRRRALALVLALHDVDSRLHVEATLSNVGAGHAVPSGLPGRQVVLLVRTLGSSGAEIARAERTYQRTLTDARGTEVPFFAATQLGSDSRIPPKLARLESFDLEAPTAGELQVEVLWRELSPQLSSELGIAPEEETLLSTRIPFGAPRPGGRRTLPPGPIVVRP